MKTKDLNQPAVWLLKAVILVFLLIGLLSCSTTKEVGYCEKEQEYLTLPDRNDRKIIGYKQGVVLKNRMYYKVIDGVGRPAPKIYEPGELRPIGTILIYDW